MVANVAWILELLVQRSVYFIVEQPGSTVMFLFPMLLWVLRASQARQLRTYMGAFGGKCCKPTVLWSNMPRLWKLGRPKPTGFSSKASPFYKRSADGRSVTGLKALKSTQAYPRAYAEVLLKIWLLLQTLPSPASQAAGHFIFCFMERMSCEEGDDVTMAPAAAACGGA